MRKRSSHTMVFDTTHVFHQLSRPRYRQILTTLHNCWHRAGTREADLFIDSTSACQALRGVVGLLSSPKTWV
jgi:hypothetical protein